MKSLLSLMQEEDQIVSDIDSALKWRERFLQERDLVSFIGIECEGKNEYLAHCDEQIKKYNKKIEELNKRHTYTKGRLSVYLKFLQAQGEEHL